MDILVVIYSIKVNNENFFIDFIESTVDLRSFKKADI